MLRANSVVWVTALGEETVKNCHLFDPDFSGEFGSLGLKPQSCPETVLLSEQHESTPLKTEISDLSIGYGLLHRVFEETPVHFPLLNLLENIKLFQTLWMLLS